MLKEEGIARGLYGGVVPAMIGSGKFDRSSKILFYNFPIYSGVSFYLFWNL
jgi:hypothetical protein